jgi:predicted Rossmann fold flavoprotein
VPTENDVLDCIIVGAGAAGLMAAIAAAQRGARVRVLDSQTKIGAKILVAGGGRCNVTNEFVDATRFNTTQAERGPKSFVARVLRSFSVEQTHRFFNSIGVPLKLEQTGKYFPTSDSSRTVLNALLDAVRDSGAELITDQLVTSVKPSTQDGLWTVRTADGELQSRAVILCTGGLALPKSGSNGAGYVFATRLGHTLVQTTPALTPLLANCPPHAALSGNTLPVRLTLKDGDKTLVQFSGSFLFTHVGYSGPVALNMSRHFARERWQHPDATIFLRLLPEVEDGTERRFWHEFVGEHAKQTLVNALGEILPRRVAEMVVEYSKVPPQALVGKLSGDEQKRVQGALLDMLLPVHAVADYVKAEATAGGISLDEIESATMMSKVHNGLFFAGEICDVDGWLGGYNFQWAWSSGTVAGRSAARYAIKQKETRENKESHE